MSHKGGHAAREGKKILPGRRQPMMKVNSNGPQSWQSVTLGGRTFVSFVGATERRNRSAGSEQKEGPRGIIWEASKRGWWGVGLKGAVGRGVIR